MRMDTRIPMMGMQPDIVGSYSRGQDVRQNALAMQDANALRDLYREQGSQIMAGDANALSALAQHDPRAALAIQGDRQTMDIRGRADQRAATQLQHGMKIDNAQLEITRQNAARQAAEAARSASQQELAEAAEEAERFGTGLLAMYQQGPNAWRPGALDPELAELPFDEAPVAIAMMRGTLDGLQSDAKPTDDMREYEAARAQGYQGTLQDWITQARRAGATNVTTNVNQGEDTLRKKLSEKEGEQWAGYLEKGAAAGANNQSFQMLDELVGMAPQGPIQGRLAAQFPGVSSAGAAFESIVLPIAPTLRAEGSGSTSDVEYEGMLRGLPALRNRPDANRLILGTMKAKNDINLERAQIVTAFQNDEIDATEARRLMRELDRKSILSPEMKRLLGEVGGGGKTVIDGYTVEPID